MQPCFYKPHPALANYISHIMIMEAKFNTAHHSFSPFPPTPQHMINFYPFDVVKTYNKSGIIEVSPQSVIVGPQVSKVNVAMGKHHLIISVGFQPGGMYRLLRLPLSELFDMPFDADLVLGADMKEVNDKLKYATTHQQMKAIIEAFFIKRIRQSTLLPWEHVMKLQLSNNGAMSIEKAASLSCLSLRQFERRTKEIMGYSPKVFSRLIRFSNAYRLKENQINLSWTSIAYACGYFDQMHMIRDFKDFTGVAPGVIERQLEDAPMKLQQGLQI
jgi:AraC-like DNA-binding protein